MRGKARSSWKTYTDFRELFLPERCFEVQLDADQDDVWKIDTKFTVGWLLSKIADSETFRENNII